MRLFGKYLKQKMGVTAAFFAFAAIFAVCFALFHLPVRAVVYPTVLCGALGAAILMLDFRQMRKKHLLLSRAKELAAQLIDELPEAKSVAEEDYQEIIASIKAQMFELADKMEREQRESKEYYTVWTHQIKTPIASMRLMLQGEDTALSNRLQSELNRIEQYAQMALAYVRLEQPANDYVFKECKVDDIVRQSVRRFASEFIMRRLTLDYSPVAFTAVTDEKWLAFVIEQVLSNALKYTREGGVRIFSEEPKTLRIEDTGIGIAEEDLPRIFEPGYTGGNGRIDKSASGIGLYLCRRVCGELGASISVSSAAGKGTTVRIDLKQYELKRE